MKTQRTLIPADTYLRVQRAPQPPRLRAFGAFSDAVDKTALTVIRFSPPLTIQPLTLAALGRNSPGGGKKVVPTVGQTTPALIPTIMNTRAHFLRVARFAREPIAPWTPTATVLSHPQWRAPKGLFALHSIFSFTAYQSLTALFRGKFTPH